MHTDMCCMTLPDELLLMVSVPAVESYSPTLIIHEPQSHPLLYAADSKQTWWSVKGLTSPTPQAWCLSSYVWKSVCVCVCVCVYLDSQESTLFGCNCSFCLTAKLKSVLWEDQSESSLATCVPWVTQSGIRVLCTQPIRPPACLECER